jgi:hypothetical protein
LLRELGLGGTIAFQIFLTANVLAALIHPLFMAGLGYALLALPMPWANAVLDNAGPVFATSLLSGYASTILLNLIGLCRRRLLAHGWVLVLTPLHWLLLSLAAWRALFQLLHDPQRWEKTEHGLATTSRVARSCKTETSQIRMVRSRIGKTQTIEARFGLTAPVAPVKLMRAQRDA